MRVITFCAEGIEQAAKAGFFEWVAEQDAEIICVQDIRAEEHKLQDDVYFPEGYFPYFFDMDGGENGVVIYCRQMPKAIMTGLGFIESDIEARYIQADYDGISFGSLLLPAASDDALSLEKKINFLDRFQVHLEKIKNKRRHFIFSGNWNIAHKVRDVANAEALEDTPGFLFEERRWFDELTGRLGYCDAFRQVNTDEDEFSWWPEDAPQNAMRVDYQIISSSLKPMVEYGVIYKAKKFGNHAPVVMDYDFEL